MQQKIESGERRPSSGIRSPTMAHYWCVEIMGGFHDEPQLLIAPGAHFSLMGLARNNAGNMHLDPIGAILDLTPHLGD